MTENHENSSVVHEVDGIQEEDNHLPNWWLTTLFLAIVFAFFYWEYFHVLKAGLPIMEEYAMEAQAAEDRMATLEAAKLDDTTLLAAAKGPDAELGAKVFAENCVACHGVQGEGKIGPNLTDNFWLHGGKPTQIYQTISNGFPLKGMPTWKPVLGLQKVKAVAAYILTLRNKNVPGKAPEGTEMSAADLSALTAPAAATAAKP